ncbi:hypothetical protein Pst134EA_007440 [Puccinia striiformis f. sp. tritici]|nr:uncharacterized protein Pst134EA_031279 [Puccinia striiformis f. sp. tritici]XP_047809629.1 hypothetical protein Pst134EA_007440 [Puccinia striiformis f. sp. tritici]KAH9443403.1 hypothetical protein Pst134EA_031279 [Puccinia striiformis f. sp. tritici]KAH9470175.1 hypothetical protein Pst134EA_007440 [Puccinia striiformis f. sp. tritici]KAI9627015.1 hypothetical protein KEM48_010059 [Puccinia striiformis f. sp. tritici PST-130]
MNPYIILILVKPILQEPWRNQLNRTNTTLWFFVLNPCGIQLAVGGDYSLGAVGETSRGVSSQVVSDGPCIHQSSPNQLDRDIIKSLDSGGRMLSSSRDSASRVDHSARLVSFLTSWEDLYKDGGRSELGITYLISDKSSLDTCTLQEEDPQTLQIVIANLGEKPSNEAPLKSHTTQLQQFATSSIDTKKKQPVHHQVIDIKDPSTRVSSQAQEYKKCAYCGEDLEISKDTPKLHYCAKCEQNLRLIWAEERLAKDGRCMLCQGEGKIPSAQSAVGNQLRSSDVRRTPPARTQDKIPTRQGRLPVVRNDEGSPSALARADSQDLKSRCCCLFVISAYLACTVAFVLCVLFLRKHGVQ